MDFLAPFRTKDFDYMRLKNLLGNEFWLYGLLKQELKTHIKERKITMFYPGSEADVINPMLILNSCLDLDKRHDITIYFVDPKNMDIFIRSAVQKIIRHSNVKMKSKHNLSKISFSLRRSKIKILCIKADAIRFIKKIDEFDIYFERAFEIVRAQDKTYVQSVLEKTKHMIFSDAELCSKDVYQRHGFSRAKLSKNIKEIGFYKNFTVLKKSKVNCKSRKEQEYQG